MKYTPRKVEASLKQLPIIKKYQAQAQSKTRELETTLNRIKFSMFKPYDFKIFLKERLEQIRRDTIVELREKSYLDKKFAVAYRSKKKHIQELQVAYPWIRYQTYKDFVLSVQETQGKDRNHYLKLGEIEN